MHSGIAGGIVEQHRPVLLHDGAVGEQDVGHVADPFAATGPHQKPARLGDDPGRVVQRRRVGVDDVTETGGCISHAVCDMNPALLRPDRHRAFPVFRLGDLMVAPAAQDLLLVDDRMGDIVAEAEADASARSGVDETVHRPGVEGVPSVHEFRMKHHVPLLGRVLRHQIRETFPVHQVLRPDDTGRCDRRGKIRIGAVLALGAEDAVDPPVLMLCQSHIIDVRFFRTGILELNRVVAETEAVDTVVRLGDTEKRFPVVALDPGCEAVFPAEFNGARIEDRVDAQSLLEVRIRLRIQIISPCERNMFPCQNRVPVAAENAVVFVRLLVLSLKQPFLLRLLNIILRIKHRFPSL